MRWAAALALLAGAAEAEGEPRILRADLAEPTDRYAHAVLGDALEWGALTLVLDGGPETTVTLRLPETRVFEDIATRLADVTGDGAPEVIVVETDLALGASLAVYGPAGKLAATPFIGQPNRWLAPPASPILTATGGSRSPMSTGRTSWASWSSCAWRALAWSRRRALPG
jgi:hypothetical protein